MNVLLGFVCGFVAGAAGVCLVVRNNLKREVLSKVADKLEEKAEDVRNG